MRVAGRHVDLGVVVALAWILSAVGLTVVFGPLLGLRGWGWLLVHHLLCAVGATHELRRGWRRHRARKAASLVAADPVEHRAIPEA